MKRIVLSALVLVCTLLVGMTTPLMSGQVIYNNDFETSVGSEWSKPITDVTPIDQRHFLGQFGSESVRLELVNVPNNSWVTLSFDLFIINTWDGNGNCLWSYGQNLDIWSLSTIDGQQLLRTTFSNMGDNPNYIWQSYPDTYVTYPGVNNPARKGAVENNTLGFINTITPSWGIRDSVYHLSFTTLHDSGITGWDFNGLPNQELADESWGLDNVQVSVQAVPEPSTFVAACIMFTPVVLSKLRSRRRK